MSESQAFANFINTSQRLKDQVDQATPTFEQITDDKKNFEQQFLIGAALAAKVKATDKLVGLFKKSKTISSLKGKAEDQIRNVVKSGQERAGQIAKNLTNKIVQPPQPPPPVSNTANPTDLKPLEEARDKANAQRDSTNQAKADADEELVNSRADLEASRSAEQVATDVANKALQESVASTSGAIGSDVTSARQAMLMAQKTRAAAEQRVTDAQANQERSAKLQTQHNSDADRAQQDLDNAVGNNEEAAAAAAEADKVAAAGKEASRLAKLEKVEVGLKDTEKVAAESEAEGDIGGLAVAAVAALATQFIGRSIKAHAEQQIGGISQGVIPKLNYSSTLGA
jgi:hypothetical protein